MTRSSISLAVKKKTTFLSGSRQVCLHHLGFSILQVYEAGNDYTVGTVQCVQRSSMLRSPIPRFPYQIAKLYRARCFHVQNLVFSTGALLS